MRMTSSNRCVAAGARSVRRIHIVAVSLVAAVLCLPLRSSWAQVSSPPDLRNANIAVDYNEPRDPDFLALYEKLKRRQVLEELAQFLAPVRWPKTLRMLMKECPASGMRTPEVFYSPIEYSITLCYQWLKFLHKFNPPDSFATRQEVIVGGLVGIVLHEAGCAAFDMLKVPRLGAEDDAADQIASYVGLQFGKEVAQTVIKGTYYVWDTYDYY